MTTVANPELELPLFTAHPVHEDIPTSALVRSLDVVVFPTHNSRAETWSLPVYTIKETTGMWDVLDVTGFFPAGYSSILLARDPGTNEPLPNQFRVYLDNLTSTRPLNKAVEDTLGGKWIGNVVVAKYSKASAVNRMSFAHITRGEADLLVYIVGKYLKGIWDDMVSSTKTGGD